MIPLVNKAPTKYEQERHECENSPTSFGRPEFPAKWETLFSKEPLFVVSLNLIKMFNNRGFNYTRPVFRFRGGKNRAGPLIYRSIRTISLWPNTRSNPFKKCSAKRPSLRSRLSRDYSMAQCDFWIILDADRFPSISVSVCSTAANTFCPNNSCLAETFSDILISTDQLTGSGLAVCGQDGRYVHITRETKVFSLYTKKIYDLEYFWYEDWSYPCEKKL